MFRNIVSLRRSVNLFDDLTEDADEQTLGNRVEMMTRPPTRPDVVHRGFAYSTAIAYPFQADALMQSRYSDGSFPIWYGATDESTAIHETAWHSLEQVRDTPEVTTVIHRERAVWRVHVTGLFVDLRAKVRDMPELVAPATEPRKPSASVLRHTAPDSSPRLRDVAAGVAW